MVSAANSPCSLPTATVKQHVRAFGMAFGVPLEDFDERLRVFRNCRLRRRASARSTSGRRDALAAGTVDEAQQVVRRFGLGERGVGQ
jgi:hypothetical protein